MHFTLASAVGLLALLRPVMASSWIIEFYKSGCPTADTESNIVGATAGESGDELWCIGTGSAHDAVISGLEAAGMQATFFADWGCQSMISSTDTDGCQVIPSDTVIQAVRVLPK